MAFLINLSALLVASIGSLDFLFLFSLPSLVFLLSFVLPSFIPLLDLCRGRLISSFVCVFPGQGTGLEGQASIELLE